MVKTGLLVAPSRYQEWFLEFREKLDLCGTTLLYAADVEAVKLAFAAEKIDIVFLGGTSDETEYRLEILQQIMTLSPDTSIHCKGIGNDPYWFAGGILKGLVVKNVDAQM